jgi:hypothetical protein
VVLTRFPCEAGRPPRQLRDRLWKTPQQADSEKVIAAVEPTYRLLEPITILPVQWMVCPCARMEWLRMPILRYFFYVGGALLVVLFACDAVLPKAPASDTNVAADDHPLIRIHSERKWPKPIVFDTSMPATAPVAVAGNAAAPAPVATADIPAKARLREAFAQLPAPRTAAAEPKTPEPTKPEARPQPKRKVARARTAPRSPMLVAQQPRPLMLVAQQPHFGLFDNTW